MVIGKTKFIEELYKDYIVEEYGKKYAFKIFKMYVLQLQYTNLSGKKSRTLHYHKIMSPEFLAVKKSWTGESCIQENFASHFLQNTVSLFFFCHTVFCPKNNRKTEKTSNRPELFFNFVVFLEKLPDVQHFFRF